MTNFVILFSKHKQSGRNVITFLIMKRKNFGEKSVVHIKLTVCFQLQVYGIEENIERQ